MRRQQNLVVKLKDHQGDWVEDEDTVANLIAAFYQTLFTSVPSPMNSVLKHVQPRVTEQQNTWLTAEVTNEEIRMAVFDLGPHKAPGPDGFNGFFYQSAWDEVKVQTTRMVKGFFEGDADMQNINETNLILIPKVDHPETVSHFRPISLCNFSYKIVAKVLASRLKRVLDTCISEHQRAFVPDRLIQDNSIMVHEAFHYLKNNRNSGKYEVAMNIDMNKAYDRLEWSFLEEVMLRMNFCTRWVGWIMNCVRSVSFNVQMAGRTITSFNPQRGLRQGDPLSPYLFILASEVLSLMISSHAANGSLKGIKVARSSPMLTHCMFADDTIIFLRAEESNCRVFVNLLNQYCEASGQAVNMEKSNLFFSNNTPSDQREAIAASLGVNEVENPGKYLGLPIIWGSSKQRALAFVRDRVGKKMQGWKKKCLSFSGREVMIKAVGNAIPIYSMSCFKFPKKVCQDLESLMSNFFWGNSTASSSIHWKAWPSMTKSKEEGGIGFKDFEGFNNALLAKTAWRILQFPAANWVKILKSIYFPHTSFLQAKQGNRASWGWNSILKGRDCLMRDLCWQIGSGHSISVWNDPWIPSNPMCKLVKSGQIAINEHMVVTELIKDGQWNIDPIIHAIDSASAQNIRAIPLPSHARVDKLIWKGNKDGSFSVRKAYRLHLDDCHLRDMSCASSSFVLDDAIWRKLWRITTIPRVKHFVWRVMNKAIATREALFRRKCTPDPLWDMWGCCGNHGTCPPSMPVG